MASPRKPVVGIPASVRLLESDMRFHGTAQQYLRAVREELDASVFTIPGLGAENAIELLDLVDGLLLSGSFSDIHPSNYGAPVATTSSFYDLPRDAVTMPVIRAALAHGVPVFGICRGMQEINVALGGKLSQMLHDEPGNDDHRADEERPLAQQFGPAHDIHIQPGGVLADLIPERRVVVNTAHAQGISRIAEGLRIEALADDGVVEAVSVRDARAFAVGVQFHPEWDTAGNRLYAALFGAFRTAVWKRAAERLRTKAAERAAHAIEST